MSFGEKERFFIPIKGHRPVRSLCWQGNELVDWVAGGTRFQLDGSITPARVIFAYSFDRAIATKDGTFAILYQVLGTKGLIISGAKVIREINRSFYHACTYEYPVTVFELPDGKPVLVHCPDDYNKIEIEELESGKRLTRREGEAQDFFHSRLQVSPDGKYLLSAGWIWHPLDRIQLFLLAEGLKTPAILDQYAELELPEEVFEVHAASFQGNDAVIVVGDSAGESDKPGAFLVRYDLTKKKTDLVTSLEEEPGAIMPLGNDYVIGFYEHPKLFELPSGKVVRRWPELKTGNQNSSIIHHVKKIPPFAFDADGKRFAVADENGITVILLG